jgi:hypothetical protein
MRVPDKDRVDCWPCSSPFSRRYGFLGVDTAASIQTFSEDIKALVERC